MSKNQANLRRPKDHEIAKFVNKLRGTALMYATAGQLRERVATDVKAFLESLEPTPTAEDNTMEKSQKPEVRKSSTDAFKQDPNYQIYESCFKATWAASHSVTTGLGVTTFRITNDELLQKLREHLDLPELVQLEGEFSFVANRNLSWVPQLREDNTITDATITICVDGRVYQLLMHRFNRRLCIKMFCGQDSLSLTKSDGDDPSPESVALTISVLVKLKELR